jgi:hypothetical protein
MFQDLGRFFTALVLLFSCSGLCGLSVAAAQSEHGMSRMASAGNAGEAVEDPADARRHQQWLEGLADAAARNGCNAELVIQQPNESVEEVLQLFTLTAREGSCLALFPISTAADPIRYSFASGGRVDGVEVRYLSDVSRIRIWNGIPVDQK